MAAIKCGYYRKKAQEISGLASRSRSVEVASNYSRLLSCSSEWPIVSKASRGRAD